MKSQAGKKLKNVEAVNKMIRGEHFTQTRTKIGYRDTERAREAATHREVGDVWEEKLPSGRVVIWEQREGFRVKKSRLSDTMAAVRDELRVFPNCGKDVCTCNAPTRLDKKFRITHGMCLDCVSAYETKLQIRGEFDTYARTKLFNNAVSMFNQADQEVDELKRVLSSPSTYVNGDGTIETWKTENPEVLIAKVEADYTKLKEEVLTHLNPDKDSDD